MSEIYSELLRSRMVLLTLGSDSSISKLANVQGLNEGAQFPGRQITVEGAEESRQCPSTFFNRVHLLLIDLSFEHGGTKLACCPKPLLMYKCCYSCSHAAIWFNQGYSFRQETHSLTLVAKPRCRLTLLRRGLTDCTDSRPETVFSLCRLLKSCVSSKFSIFTAFLSSLLLLLSKLPPSIEK